MAKSIQTLIPLISAITTLLLTVLSAADQLPLLPKPQTKTTAFSFDFRRVKPTSLTYQGDAHFPSKPAVLRLTKTDENGDAVPPTVGRVLYTKPIAFWNKIVKADFETNLTFIIRHNSDEEMPPADGLVFFITPVNSTFSDPPGNFGVFDGSDTDPFDGSDTKTSLFAVEFDVYVDEEYDVSGDHVGIDIQSVFSRSNTDVKGGIVGNVVTATIKYDGKTNLITVRGSAAGEKSFELSYVYDLSSFLPKKVQVGISAASRGAAAVHDVISWSFRSTRVY